MKLYRPDMIDSLISLATNSRQTNYFKYNYYRTKIYKDPPETIIIN
jgi:hypothetical protein